MLLLFRMEYLNKELLIQIYWILNRLLMHCGLMYLDLDIITEFTDFEFNIYLILLCKLYGGSTHITTSKS